MTSIVSVPGRARTSRWLEQLDRIPVGIFDLDLLPAGSDLHSWLVIAPDAATIVDILDSIPGAFERANRGLREIRSGEGIPLDDV